MLIFEETIFEQLITGHNSGAVIAIISAHPDDEVLGMGGRFNYIKNAYFIHVTDGVPQNMFDACACGFKNRQSYADARKQEFKAALKVAEIETESVIEMGIGDQEACKNLLYITYELANIFTQNRIDAVLTHPYEGGHPDHDATAFCVHGAAELIKRNGFHWPEIFEFTSYHIKDEKLKSFEFLAGDPGLAIRLSSEELKLKTEMINCFETQKKMLSQFPLSLERFRVSPKYNFAQPPHAGRLFYENFDWGCTGASWRQNAAEIIQKLGFAELI